MMTAYEKKNFNPFEEIDDMFDRFYTMGFGVPQKIRFNTGYTKDMNPAYWSEWEEEIVDSTEKEKVGYKAVCRTVGIREEDVKLELRDYGLCLDGMTEIDGQRYSQHVELPISREIMKNIDEITYHSKDGLTYIYLRMKKPEIREVPIRKIAIGENKAENEKYIENGTDKIF